MRKRNLLLFFTTLAIISNGYSEVNYFKNYNTVTLDGIEALSDTLSVPLFIEIKDEENIKRIIWHHHVDNKVYLDTQIYYQLAPDYFYKYDQGLLECYFNSHRIDINIYTGNASHWGGLESISYYGKNCYLTLNFSRFERIKIKLDNDSLHLHPLECQSIFVYQKSGSIINFKAYFYDGKRHILDTDVYEGGFSDSLYLVDYCTAIMGIDQGLRNDQDMTIDSSLFNFEIPERYSFSVIPFVSLIHKYFGSALE